MVVATVADFVVVVFWLLVVNLASVIVRVVRVIGGGRFTFQKKSSFDRIAHSLQVRDIDSFIDTGR